MALMPHITHVTTEDGSRYLSATYIVRFERKWHLFKGRKTIYVIEIDGKKYLLANGGYLHVHSNLTQVDIKISKLVKGVERSSTRLCGPVNCHSCVKVIMDVTPNDTPVFDMLLCNHEKMELV